METDLLKTLQAGKMEVLIYNSRKNMGKAAAEDVAGKLRRLLAEREEVNMLFACAVSQLEFFEELFQSPGIEWGKVNGFVMDEYMGLAADHPSVLANFAKVHIFGNVKFKNEFTMDSANEDFEGECKRYAQLLKQHPLTISCLGIGENGHLAYNDPPVADFNDPELVKTVEIDQTSRMQAVHDGTFQTSEEVPEIALTVTIPPMVAAEYISIVAPGPHKTNAITHTVNDEISVACPATILRNYNCKLYTDKDGGAGL